MKKRGTALVLLLLSAVLSVSSPAFAVEGTVVPFRQLAAGRYGGGTYKRCLVVEDQERWGSLWQEITGSAEQTPVVDFTTDAVVVVFQGMKTSGGYSIAVEAVIERPEAVAVMIREREPGPKSLVTTAFSSPWEAVAINRPTKPVCFEMTP
ncbi:MAG TPA: hypothetical protein DIC53_11930 [Synergistaceae bacterium]|nr:hypothetical protein [Synergistaceae bacterium]